MDLEQLKYPIGQFVSNNNPSDLELAQWISNIEIFPTQLESLIQGLNKEQLNYKYRPEGWMIKQVVHHCADSHMNGFIRLKLMLTEQTPTIRPYIESEWSKLADAFNEDFTDTLSILKGVHKKWAFLLRKLSKGDFQKEYFHPEYKKTVSMYEFIGTYSWHCRHHLAHIKQALEAKGKYR